MAGTNTYLIFPPRLQQNPTFVLIDTGQGSAFPAWRRSIAQVLASESARVGKQVRITQCVLTHWHHDHVGGISELRQLCAEHSSSKSSAESEEEKGREEELRIYKYPLSCPSETSSSQDPTETSLDIEGQLLRSANDDQDVGLIHPLHDGQILQVGDLTATDDEVLKLQVLHTPGHTVDHVALLIVSSPADQAEVGTIFTGDAVLGHGTAVFEDLGLYMQSLEKMKRARQKAVMDRGDNGQIIGGEGKLAPAFPGHGAVIPDARAKIEDYIRHRAMREKEVLNVLAGVSAGQDGKAGSERKTWTAMEIVKVVYKDVPESLHEAASGGVLQVLRKLEREGKVESVDEGARWRIIQTHTEQKQPTNDNSIQEPRSAL